MEGCVNILVNICSWIILLL